MRASDHRNSGTRDRRSSSLPGRSPPAPPALPCLRFQPVIPGPTMTLTMYRLCRVAYEPLTGPRLLTGS